MRYEDLSDAEHAAICNGCGAKGGPVQPPEWHSEDTCNRHDFAYWRGGDAQARRAADRELLNGMKRDAATRPWWQQPWYRAQAWIYFVSVRVWGRPHFHETTTPRDAIDAALLARRYETMRMRSGA
jgi:hypothetical protein